MAKDKTRHSNSTRYEYIIDGGDDHTKWSDAGLGTAANISSSVQHITGSSSVSFDKTAGDADVFIYRQIAGTGMDLNEFSLDGMICFSMYFPTTSGMDSAKVRLYSDENNYHTCTVTGTYLNSEWNNFKVNCNDGYQTGDGVNWTSVSGIGVGITFDDAADTISSVLLDSVRIRVPVFSVDLETNIDNVTTTSMSLGSVKIADGSAADEAKVNAANTIRSTSTNVMTVQHVDATGKVLPAGDTNSNAPFVKLTGGTTDWSLDAANTARTTATKVLPVQMIDEEGSVVGESVGGGGGGGNMLYLSPQDFSAAYNSASGIALTGLTFVPVVEQFVSVTKFDSAGLAVKYTPDANDFDYDSSTGYLNLGGSPGFASGDQGYLVQVYGPDKAYNSNLDANKSYVMNPDSGHYSSSTLASVTDGTDGTYYYYVDMSSYDKVGFQLELNGGSAGATTGVIATCEATLQDDSTAPGSCTYHDKTDDVFGVTNLTAAPATTASGMWLDHEGKLGFAKYVRIRVNASTTSDSGDWTIYAKKM